MIYNYPVQSSTVCRIYRYIRLYQRYNSSLSRMRPYFGFEVFNISRGAAYTFFYKGLCTVGQKPLHLNLILTNTLKETQMLWDQDD